MEGRMEQEEEGEAEWGMEQNDGGADGEEDGGRGWSRMMDGRWREDGGECGGTGGGENEEDE